MIIVSFKITVYKIIKNRHRVQAIVLLIVTIGSGKFKIIQSIIPNSNVGITNHYSVNTN